MNRRALVVDDEQDIRTIMGLNLRLEGIETDEAADGDEAIAALRAQRYDAVLLDIAMPKTDGYAVLRAIAGEGLGDMPIVVLSARGSPTDAIEALELGADMHVVKPFSPAAVAGMVKELIALDPGERARRRQALIERGGALNRLGVPKF